MQIREGSESNQHHCGGDRTVCRWVRGQLLWTVTKQRKANWPLETPRRKQFLEPRFNSYGVMRKVANASGHWAFSVRRKKAMGLCLERKGLMKRVLEDFQSQNGRWGMYGAMFQCSQQGNPKNQKRWPKGSKLQLPSLTDYNCVSADEIWNYWN